MNTFRCDTIGFTLIVIRDMRAITENDNFIPEVTHPLLNIANTLRAAPDEHVKQQDKTKRYAALKRR